MTRLKNILVINAVTSGATALLLIAFPGFIAELFGITHTAPFIGIGTFLLFFAGYVFLQSLNEPFQSKKVRTIIVTDILWVIGSLAIILAQLFGMSLIGYLLTGGVALWVALMAFLQLQGLRKYELQPNI